MFVALFKRLELMKSWDHVNVSQSANHRRYFRQRQLKAANKSERRAVVSQNRNIRFDTTKIY
jgi:hypothetical protein